MNRTNFTIISNAVIDRISEVGVVAFAVYAVLAKYADKQGRCWPSERTIGKSIKRNTRTVRDAIRELEGAGLLEQQRRGRGATAVYTLIQDRQSVAGHEESRPAISDIKTGNFQHQDRQSVAGPGEQDPGNNTQGTKGEGSDGQYDFRTAALPYQSERFKAAWQDFAQMRVEKQNPLTAQAAKIALRQLAEWGESAAITALETSTVSRWPGLFEPRAKKREPVYDPAPFDN